MFRSLQRKKLPERVDSETKKRNKADDGRIGALYLQANKTGQRRGSPLVEANKADCWTRHTLSER